LGIYLKKRFGEIYYEKDNSAGFIFGGFGSSCFYVPGPDNKICNEDGRQG
jgi:hypothetical protein